MKPGERVRGIVFVNGDTCFIEDDKTKFSPIEKNKVCLLLGLF